MPFVLKVLHKVPLLSSRGHYNIPIYTCNLRTDLGKECSFPQTIALVHQIILSLIIFYLPFI